MKNKLKPINSTKIISTQIRNNSKTEIVLPKKKANTNIIKWLFASWVRKNVIINIWAKQKKK